jgi:hypothetical protein
MEGEPLNEETSRFDRDKSPAREAYALLGAQTPIELSNLYSAEDQRLMRSGAWDYENEELVVNQVKNILESLDPLTLTEEEQVWRQEILWFWYHHAISCAIWRYKDKNTAQDYATMALEYQSEDHPNKITKLLYFLVNDQLEEAEQWAAEIDEEPEKSTAADLVKEYKDGDFF